MSMTVQPRNHNPEPLELSWSLGDEDIERIRLRTRWPADLTREWAWGDGAGEGVRVCLLDSGVDRAHPLVGPVEAYAVEERLDGDMVVVPEDEGDVCGHGTACASIVRAMAPKCNIVSVRVLGLGYFGRSEALIAGLRWAIDNDVQVINMSLSTTQQEVARTLSTLADKAYFRRKLVVASAHNTPVASFPWRFASVISVGSHQEKDPDLFLYNPAPPVEFFARGLSVPVAWTGGGRTTCSGNSFATPHMAGMCARILGAHPELTPFQVKTILHLTAANVVREA